MTLAAALRIIGLISAITGAGAATIAVITKTWVLNALLLPMVPSASAMVPIPVVGWRFTMMASGAVFVTIISITMMPMSLACSWVSLKLTHIRSTRMGEAQAQFSWMIFAALMRRVGSISAITVVGAATIAVITKTWVFSAMTTTKH